MSDPDQFECLKSAHCDKFICGHADLIPQPEIQELLFAVQPTQCQAPEIYHSAIGDKLMFSIFCWATGYAANFKAGSPPKVGAKVNCPAAGTWGVSHDDYNLW